MTYIRINIIINEEAIHAKAIKAYKGIQTHVQQYYRPLFELSHAIGQRHCTQTILGRVYIVLAQRFNREPLPAHTILCECGGRKCPGRTLSVSTYARKMRTTS